MEIKIKSYSGETVSLIPKVALYTVHDFMGKEMPGLAIILEEGEGMGFDTLTVSFGEFIGMKNAAYIDINNCPFADQILALGVAENTGFTKNSGFCSYPLWVFKEDFLTECGKENYKKYADAYDAYMRAAEE